MNTRLALILCFAALLVASCRPTAVTVTPAAPPFPTVTPGRFMQAALPAPANPGDPLQSNPATAIAMVSQPTPTPNLASCPAVNESLSLPPDPPPVGLIDTTLADFLTDGGTLVALESGLRQWGMIDGDNGGTQGDLDLTGEGIAETVIRYTANGEGVLLIVGCIDGRIIDRYRASYGAEAPQVISASDANFNGIPDLLFAAVVCDEEGACLYRAQMVTWQPDRGRFINLIGEPLLNGELPALEDIDSDRVGEIIARQSETGGATTGPLRTGYVAWDWDGSSYVRSVTQLDPPRYRIQVIQEADAALAAGNYDEAISQLQFAIDEPTLEDWMPDDAVTLKAYGLYRLLLAYSAVEDQRRITVQGRLLSEYPDTAAAPPYVEMGLEFWNGLQVTNNLRAACGEALEVVSVRMDAVGLLNRYGTRAPLYDAASLCPL